MIKTVFVVGPTAIGKTSLAVSLAEYFQGEIISADSRQVYSGLDIGSGKDLQEYESSGGCIPYHLIDICDIRTDKFSVYDFQKNASKLTEDIYQRKSLPIICGGSSLHISSLINHYDFKKPNITAKRLFEECLLLVPYWCRSDIHKRIEQRLKMRWEGMIVEVERLLNDNVSKDTLEWLGLEYRYIKRFLFKEISEKECFEQLLIKIRNFVRRQDMWLRKLERQGHNIYYLDQIDKKEQAKNLVKCFLNGEDLPKPKISLLNIYYGPKSDG